MAELNQIVAGCKRNDRNAQKYLFDLYKSTLMGICRRYCSSHEEAQDVLQDSFIKIFSRIRQLTEPEKLGSWVTRITINTAISNYHKSKGPEHVDIENLSVDDTEYESIQSNINTSDDDLIRAINSLPARCRIVFNLYIVEGYSHAEIAAMIGVTESTSRSQLNYAKGLLKEKLRAIEVNQCKKYA